MSLFSPSWDVFACSRPGTAYLGTMHNAMNFSATIEYLPGQRAAIIELTDSRGEWAGGGRIDVRPINGDVRGALYEAGYVHASACAAAKGGRLDRFSEYAPPRARRLRREVMSSHAPERSFDVPCPSRACAPMERRPANALNIEIGTPQPRCLNKQPSEWHGRGASSLRWIASGGSPLVFGHCTPGACPNG